MSCFEMGSERANGVGSPVFFERFAMEWIYAIGYGPVDGGVVTVRRAVWLSDGRSEAAIKYKRNSDKKGCDRKVTASILR